jgi:hypothetical protein
MSDYIAALAVVHLEPHVLRERLSQWLAAGREGCWASTLEQDP